MSRVFNASDPEHPVTPESLQRADRDRDKKHMLGRYVVEKASSIVAVGRYTETGFSSRPGKFDVRMAVNPAHQKGGIATALYQHLLDGLNELDATQLVCAVREDHPAAMHMVNKYGYELEMRIPVSRLFLEQFDAGPHQGALSQVEAQGISIVSLEELSTRAGDWKRRIWDLLWELQQDVPYPEPPTRQTFEQFCKYLERPSFMPDAFLCAVDGQEWIAVSSLEVSAAGPQDRMYTGLTAVKPDYRCRGIATALKLSCINLAVQRGATFIETENEENNPILKLNRRLGFQTFPAHLLYKKLL